MFGMMRLTFFFFALLLSFSAQAQVVLVGSSANKKEVNDSTGKKSRTVRLSGRVYDSFTKAALKAHVTLMRSDSSVVDTTTCWMWSWGTSDSYYSFTVPRTPQKYIIKAESDGYHTGYLDYDLKHIARNREMDLPRLLLKKKAEDDIFAEGSLDDVVVTGTKVKIAYRGDTVVYNASAFNLPEGSMLDGLIREMPGAELKDNGDIYVNGRKVDFLTLNGKDFFKGNNKVMLDNLPYYTVQNVEVYDKSSEESQWRGEESSAKDYVMDVILKREYNRGLLVNMEAGVGTYDRYLARIFALYYTDHTRLSMFGNTNNVNEDRRPGYEGDWSPANQPQGLRSTKQAGINLTTEDGDKNVDERFGATLTWNDADDQTRTSRERFSSENNVFSGSESWSRQKDFRFNASNYLVFNVPFKLRMYTSVNYSNGDRLSQSSDSTWNKSSLSSLINRTYNLGFNKYRTISLSNSLNWYHKLKWGDYITLSTSVNYSNNKPSDSFSQNLVEYLQTGSHDFRNRYTDAHNNSYSYDFHVGYDLSLLNGWGIYPKVGYKQSFNSSHNFSYRLDRLVVSQSKRSTKAKNKVKNRVPEYSINSERPIGWLPSNEQLFTVLDKDNSDLSTDMERTYSASLELTKDVGDDEGWIAFNFPLEKINETLRYDDGSLDTIAHRSDIIFQPSFSFYRWGKRYQRLEYNMEVARPDFTSLMPTDDTTNPLMYTYNNPKLKNRITHNFGANFNFNSDSTAQRISLWANLSIVRNSWGTRSSYNGKTGAYSFTQDNVNGNWNGSVGVGFERPLGKARLFTVSSNTTCDYNHSVDFDLLQNAAAGTQEAQLMEISSPLSKVNTTNLSEELHLDYQKNKLSLSVIGKVNWRNSHGTSANFTTINAWDYSYGMTAKYTIPAVNIDLATDLKMFSRRGYNSSMMNTDDLVWNASLSRAFIKGKLIAKLMAFDILHQLSSTQYSVNAQGRTETWHNCIPRYALLTLSYKFQKMPKNKKK